ALAARAAVARPSSHPARVLRGEDAVTIQVRDAKELTEELRPFLSDVARQHGAHEVTLWRRAAGDGAGLEIVACSREGPLPVAGAWGAAQERALVEWSATEQMVGFERHDNEPTVAICPVKFTSGEPTGAIVLRASRKFLTERDALRDWLPRHAAQVGRLVSLFTTRNEVARQSRFTRALLRISRDLQRTHRPVDLERILCDYACDVTGGEFAALVRWDHTTGTGVVSACSAAAPPLLQPGGAVHAGSLVGTTCADTSAGFWEDARFLVERGGVLREGDEGFAAGSFAVLPMLRGGDAIGALVVGAERAGVLRGLELRNGSVLGALAVNALEAAWELAESSLRSRTDALTGLWNRRHFDEQLERVLNETDRFGSKPCALVICDIDFFKKVNDTFGHDAGDAVLVKVAHVLREGVRTVDVCARLGGEEFALLLPQTDVDGAVELADRLRMQVEALTILHAGVSIRVTISMGVATYDPGTPGKGQIFKRADERLYGAKDGGRNRVVS
ncbi:MAG: GGDEF domain-containing protein, partial [Gemmatimonadaceae bacterium]